MAESTVYGAIRRPIVRERAMFFASQLINNALWNRADWMGISFLVDQAGTLPPRIGLLFKHAQAGRSVFMDLIRKLEPNDPRGLLRVAVIEGPFRDGPHGYVVHLGAYADNSLQEAAAQAGDALEMEIAIPSRICRVQSRTGEPNAFQLFKPAYERHRMCVLLPGGPTSDTLNPHDELGIQKTEVVIRRASDVKPHGDQDIVALG
jgi:hypothetical protein